MMPLTPLLAGILTIWLAERPPPRAKAPADAVDVVLRSIPKLKTVTPTEVQRAWGSIKNLGSLAAQMAALGKKNVEALSCKGLVDFRDLAQPGGPLAGIAFRDSIRNRGWSRPTLALLLTEAYQQLQREFPGRYFTVGDVAQPGCGQINHGVLVDEIEGDRAANWLRSTSLVRGVPTTIEFRKASDYPYESIRFESPDQSVRVTTTARAALRNKGAEPRVRVARTRHLGTAKPGDSELATMGADFQALVRADKRVSATMVDDARGKLGLWHFVDKRKGLQLQVLASGDIGRPPRLDRAIELRFGRWQDQKPGSFPGEVLWVRGADGWQRWVQLNEAGHITHLSGVDADISYITSDNRSHFAIDIPAMDVAATWRWFEILDENARRLTLKVDAILVDASIRDHLRANLPMRGPGSVARHRLWSLIKISAGHDGHHHLRIAEPGSKLESHALKKLGRR